MSNSVEILERLCQSYSNAVHTSDSLAYARLFSPDAIRMPPGAEPEVGREQIQRSEQADYDMARWQVKFTLRDVLAIGEDWIYAIADVELSMQAYADGRTASYPVLVTWLLHRQPSGAWLIKRQIWNHRSE